MLLNEKRKPSAEMSKVMLAVIQGGVLFSPVNYHHQSEDHKTEGHKRESSHTATHLHPLLLLTNNALPVSLVLISA